MMKIDIPYGLKDISLEVPDTLAMEVLRPNDVGSSDEELVLKAALASPFEDSGLKVFLEGSERLLIIINDGARPTPTARVLDAISDVLAHYSPDFLIATGTHRAPTDDELKEILGSHYSRYRQSIFVHDARASEEMEYLGTSRNGTKMSFNRRLLDADRIVIIGSVEPHYFAGWTGGRKSILPGVAAFETIQANHSYAMSTKALPLALEGNPVSDDMDDALDALDESKLFSIQAILDSDKKIFAATAGDIRLSFAAAVKKAEEVYCVKSGAKTDIVISAARPPLDQDLYQSQKALEHGKIVLKDGGVIIIVSQCPNGVGNAAFLDFMKTCSDPSNVAEKIKGEGYSLGYHKSARIAETVKVSDIWAVTEIPNSEIESLFMKPFTSLQDAFDLALEKMGTESRLTILLDGSVTVPVIQ